MEKQPMVQVDLFGQGEVIDRVAKRAEQLARPFDLTSAETVTMSRLGTAYMLNMYGGSDMDDIIDMNAVREHLLTSRRWRRQQGRK